MTWSIYWSVFYEGRLSWDGPAWGANGVAANLALTVIFFLGVVWSSLKVAPLLLEVSDRYFPPASRLIDAWGNFLLWIVFERPDEKQPH